MKQGYQDEDVGCEKSLFDWGSNSSMDDPSFFSTFHFLNAIPLPVSAPFSFPANLARNETGVGGWCGTSVCSGIVLSERSVRSIFLARRPWWAFEGATVGSCQHERVAAPVSVVSLTATTPWVCCGHGHWLHYAESFYLG